MKKILKSPKNQKLLSIVLVGLFAAVGVWFLILTKAEAPVSVMDTGNSAGLSLTPSSATYTNGSSFEVKVFEDSGAQEVNAVDIGVVYEPGKLEYVKTDLAGSQFSPATAPTASGGVVNITSYINPGTIASGNVTGKQLVATITFKALASSGSSNITFMKNTDNPPRSAIYLYKVGTNIWNGNTAGGTFSFSAQSSDPGNPPPTSGGGTNTPPTGSTPKTSPKPSTGGTGTPTTTTPEQPGTVTTSNESSQTQIVSIRVLDGNEKAVLGATVNLDGQKAVTGADGLATFQVKPGNYIVTAKAKSGNGKINVTVAADSTTVPLQFSMTINNPWYSKLPIIATAVISVLALIGGLSILRSRSQAKVFGSSHSTHYDSAVVTGSGDSKKKEVVAPFIPSNSVESTVIKPTINAGQSPANPLEDKKPPVNQPTTKS